MRKLLFTVLVVLATGLIASPASAVDPGKGKPGYCPDATGVTVVVDFQGLGGDAIIRCAPGPQASGLTALQNSGMIVAGTQRWGLAFICRIEGKPGPETESCADTPPATAFWGYWHAANGGGWAYSQRGVANRKPPAGSFEGWSFSQNQSANPAPRIAPTRPGQPVAPVPPPAEQNGEIPGQGGVPQAPPVNKPAAPPAQAPQPSPTPPSSSAPASSSVPPTSAPPTAATSDGVAGGVAPGGVTWTGGQASATDDAFPWGAVFGGAAILVLGGAGGYVAWRRKRAS
jgi:hypothetical protein